jgi:hypothetical protein
LTSLPRGDSAEENAAAYYHRVRQLAEIREQRRQIVAPPARQPDPAAIDASEAAPAIPLRLERPFRQVNRHTAAAPREHRRDPGRERIGHHGIMPSLLT